MSPAKAPMLGTNPPLGKRDSFGRSLVNASISNKAELQTLVEEDEEEDENAPKDAFSVSHVPFTPVMESDPIEARSASLPLRSLSLVSDLPTPNSTPSPRGPAGMRQLTLQASPFVSNSPSPFHRPSSGLSPEPMSPISVGDSTSSFATRRQTQLAIKRSLTDSDVSMESNNNPLTPSRTPESSISSATSGDRPLSPTEVFAHQAFTLQNHVSLLERIAVLEQALTLEKHKSSSADELIALVGDLKVERDQLHGNVAEAMQRHAELERAGEVSKKRLETARQEAWLHRDRAEMLQVEVDKVKAEKTALELEKAAWSISMMKEKQAHDTELKQLQELCERMKRELNDAQHSVRRYMSSVDSSATTVVDDCDSSFDSLRISAPKLKDANLASVAEVDEVNHDDDGYGDNYAEGGELASYEIEPTECMNCVGQYSDEDEDFPDKGHHNDSTSTPSVKTVAPASRPAPQHKHTSSHVRSASLVTSWKFPHGSTRVSAKKQPECDPFKIEFDEDGDSQDPTPLSTPPQVLGTPMLPNTPAKEIPPVLAETFTMNFQEDEDFTFGGMAESVEVIESKAVPATEQSKASIRPGLLGCDQSNVPIPGRGPEASTVSTAFPVEHLSRLHGDLVPTSTTYPRQVGALLAPMVATLPEAQSPVTPKKSAFSPTNAQRPVHLFTPPPRVTRAILIL